MRILSLIFFLVSFVTYGSSEEPFLKWKKTYDGGGKDQAWLIKKDPSGFIFSAGTKEDENCQKLILRKFKSNGKNLWTKLSPCLQGKLKHLRYGPKLNLYAVTQNEESPYLSKYNRRGKKLWEKELETLPVGLEVKRSKVCLGGKDSKGFFAECYRRSNGKVLWRKSFESPELSATSFALDQKGDLLVGGNKISSYTPKMMLVKFHHKNGKILFSTAYPESSSGRSSIDKLCLSQDNQIYAVGEIEGYGGMLANKSLAKFNSEGEVQWTSQIGRVGANSVTRIEGCQVDKEGNPIIIGSVTDFYNINPNGETTRAFVMKFDKENRKKAFKAFPSDPDLSHQTIEERAVHSFLDKEGFLYVATLNETSGMRLGLLKVEAETGKGIWEYLSPEQKKSETKDLYAQGDLLVLATTEYNTSQDFSVISLEVKASSCFHAL